MYKAWLYITSQGCQGVGVGPTPEKAADRAIAAAEDVLVVREWPKPGQGPIAVFDRNGKLVGIVVTKNIEDDEA